jgi:WD40 repeat protein
MTRWLVLALVAGVASWAGGRCQAQQPKLRTTLTDEEPVMSVVFSPNGKLLASGSWDKTIKLWEVKTGKERATLKGHTERVYSVMFSPDGKLLASSSWDKTIKLWDIPAPKMADE